jgi:hypothetical protein
MSIKKIICFIFGHNYQYNGSIGLPYQSGGMFSGLVIDYECVCKRCHKNIIRQKKW